MIVRKARISRIDGAHSAAIPCSAMDARIDASMACKGQPFSVSCLGNVTQPPRRLVEILFVSVNPHVGRRRLPAVSRVIHLSEDLPEEIVRLVLTFWAHLGFY